MKSVRQLKYFRIENNILLKENICFYLAFLGLQKYYFKSSKLFLEMKK